MNFIRGNDDQDRGDSLVPEGAMKIDDAVRVDLRDLTKVNDRTAFLAENAVNAELLNNSAKGMGLWHLPRYFVELVHARKEMGRLTVFEAEVLLPVLLRCGSHLRGAPFPFETVAGSARRW